MHMKNIEIEAVKADLMIDSETFASHGHCKMWIRYCMLSHIQSGICSC